MFKNKPFGWITAGTLLCVALIAIVCRLNEGVGSTANAQPTPVADADTGKPVSTADSVDTTKDPVSEPKPSTTTDTETPASPEVATKPVDLPNVELKAPEPATTPATPAPLPPVDLATGPPAAPVASPPSAAPTTSLPAPIADGAATAPPVAPKPTPSLVSEPSPSRLTTEAGDAKLNIVPASPAAVPTAPVADDKAKSDPPPVPNLPTPKIEPAKPVETTPPGGEQPSKLRSIDVEPAPLIRKEIPSAAPAAADFDKVTSTPAPVDVGRTVSPPSPSSYKVKGNGETFREIAGRSLGDEERWDEIYRLNPELKKQLIVPAGTMVKLPTGAPPAQSNVVQTGGTQVESEPMPTEKGSTVRPLPVIRSKPQPETTVVVPPLTGSYSMTMEAGHVLQLPKEVCDQLGKADTVLLTPGPDHCLWLCTQASAAKVFERVEKSKAGDGEVQAFRRLYWSQSEKTSCNAGSIKVSDKLADYAGLGSSVVLVGIDDHFELWDAARWRRYSQQTGSSSRGDD